MIEFERVRRWIRDHRGRALRFAREARQARRNELPELAVERMARARWDRSVAHWLTGELRLLERTRAEMLAQIDAFVADPAKVQAFFRQMPERPDLLALDRVEIYADDLRDALRDALVDNNQSEHAASLNPAPKYLCDSSVALTPLSVSEEPGHTEGQLRDWTDFDEAMLPPETK